MSSERENNVETEKFEFHREHILLLKTKPKNAQKIFFTRAMNNSLKIAVIKQSTE